MTKNEVALIYASWGWHVLPVLPNEKRPGNFNGLTGATTNIEQINEWWGKNPEFNIGVATGARSNIMVYDIDPRNGGDVAWSQWVSENGQVPDGIMQLTAGGGIHHIAKYDSRFAKCQLVQGVDLLAEGDRKSVV